MKETLELPSFTAPAIRCRAAFLLVSLLSSIAWILTSGCSVKQTIKVEVPEAIRQAQTASYEELLGVLGGYDQINSLSCNKVTLTYTSSGKAEDGIFEILKKYKEVGAYILLKRPDALRLVARTPIIQSTLFDVISVGDDFSFWYPSENKIYEGKNSARELIMEDSSGVKDFTDIPIRGPHIFEAIFPQSIVLDAPGIWVNEEEQTDERASYYVLSVLKEGKRPRIHTIRKIWIERSGMTIARQQVFEEDHVVSDVIYSDVVRMQGLSLPQHIVIKRPVDKYTLDMTFKGWNINPDLPDDAFKLPTLPRDAQIIHLKDKEK